LDKDASQSKEETSAEGGEDGETDGEVSELFVKALALVVSSGTAAISQLQRRFQIGYARAGGLIDKMERMGYISGNEGSKARRVLISREEFEQKFGPISDSY
jgi:S-DNA-T family DNA segregation ATPase FtsK/SpoIIIE